MAAQESPDDVVQVVVRVRRREREQLNEIATARRERDAEGRRGASVVLTRAVRRYISANRELLPDRLRD